MKTNTPLLLEGSIFSILGGLLLFFGHLFNVFSDSQITLSGQASIFFAHSFLIFGFILTFAKYSHEIGKVGNYGILFSILGSIAVCSVVFVEISKASGIEISQIFKAPVVSEIHSIGPLFFVIGLLMFGISIIKLNSLLKWVGVLLIAGNIIFAAGSFSSSIKIITEFLGSLFTACGFILLGYNLLKQNHN